jgi:hypothetical protein
LKTGRKTKVCFIEPKVRTNRVLEQAQSLTLCVNARLNGGNSAA